MKRCKKRGLDIGKINTAIDILETEGSLPPEYKPHKLSGKWDNAWECHIEPDWLMVWQQYEETITIVFIATGSHSDLF